MILMHNSNLYQFLQFHKIAVILLLLEKFASTNIYFFVHIFLVCNRKDFDIIEHMFALYL